MSPTTDRVRERVRQLPPPMRWGLAAIGIIVLLVFLDDYSWSLAREWNQESAELERLLDEGARLSAPLGRSAEAAVRAFGRIDVPSTEAEGSQVNSILAEHHGQARSHCHRGQNCKGNQGRSGHVNPDSACPVSSD